MQHKSRMTLVSDLVKKGWLKTPEIIRAFKDIKRKDFLTDGTKHLSELNGALPIGFGQTISQPLTVAFMLELLQPKAKDKILDIGFGSGWTGALLANIVSAPSGSGHNGEIIAIESVFELKEFGERNIAKYGFIQKKIVRCIFDDGSKGFKKEAPYDKILVSAASKTSLPAKAWKEQLKTGGSLVCPIQNSIWLFIRKSKNEFQNKEYPGFVFVPLV